MYSKIPCKEDCESGDGEDSKFLPSPDQPPLLSQAFNPANRLKTYLHLTAIAIYCTLTIVLYLWSVELHAAKCECRTGEVYCE